MTVLYLILGAVALATLALATLALIAIGGTSDAE
jgi:hypothetical protein